jgi:exopolysaccharide biosynthesis WecB/TagA/CpsF family protein
MPIDRGGVPLAVPFLDLDFSPLSLDDAIVEVVKRAAQPRFSYVVTPNVDHVVQLHNEAKSQIMFAFRAAYQAADLLLCDSRILARLALLFGIRLPVVPGSDLTATLFRRAISVGDRVAIIGGKQDTVARLARLFPGPDYAQHIPPMGMLGNPAAMSAADDFIAAVKANYVLFAIGAPQSEILAHRCAERGAASGVGLCIGASIDFLLGDQRRAPAWMQRAGLEWAHRLGSSPQRLWRRYLVEGPKIFLVAARWRYGKGRSARR